MSQRIRHNSIEISLGKNLRRIREARITMEQLATAIGVKFQSIQRYETGKMRIALSTAIMIADVLGIKVSDLTGGVESGVPVACPRRRYYTIEDFYDGIKNTELKASLLNMAKAMSNQ